MMQQMAYMPETILLTYPDQITYRTLIEVQIWPG
ncbi:MAG: hypothetical protein JWM78_160 [Verrucomicrobiaceae bacterium]|nr:hypothetical protein [Verrucomicrobiaceae bacterium]